jgi:hypothetical protein
VEPVHGYHSCVTKDQVEEDDYKPHARLLLRLKDLHVQILHRLVIVRDHVLDLAAQARGFQG